MWSSLLKVKIDDEGIPGLRKRHTLAMGMIILPRSRRDIISVLKRTGMNVHSR